MTILQNTTVAGFYYYQTINDIGEVTACYASSSKHAGSYRSPCCTSGPSSYHGFYGQQQSVHAAHGACGLVCRSSWFLGLDALPCGKGLPLWLQRICMWSPLPPSMSWELANCHSIGQHAPVKKGQDQSLFMCRQNSEQCNFKQYKFVYLKICKASLSNSVLENSSSRGFTDHWPRLEASKTET